MYRKDHYARDRVMASARLLLPHLNENDTVLDVGCFTQEAKKYYPRWIKYIGIDEKAYHHETQVVDLNGEWGGLSPSYKGILALEVLEHLVKPRVVLSRLVLLLATDGRIVISLPNEVTLFHRIRCLVGTVDGEAFASEGKHLHLPSLAQARAMLREHFQIERELYYISPSACGSKQAWVGRILALVPDRLWNTLARWKPTLFARGWIFLLRKRGESYASSPQPQA